MTAIAYRAGILAGDSQDIAGRLRVGIVEKIARRADGALAGASGRADLCSEFLGLFKEGTPYLPEFLCPKKDGEADFSGLMIEPDGTVWDYTEYGRYQPGRAEWHVLGSAYAFLHGAMAAGASAEQAVRLAVEHCADCGGNVTVLYLPGAR